MWWYQIKKWFEFAPWLLYFLCLMGWLHEWLFSFSLYMEIDASCTDPWNLHRICRTKNKYISFLSKRLKGDYFKNVIYRYVLNLIMWYHMNLWVRACLLSHPIYDKSLHNCNYLLTMCKQQSVIYRLTAPCGITKGSRSTIGPINHHDETMS